VFQDKNLFILLKNNSCIALQLVSNYERLVSVGFCFTFNTLEERVESRLNQLNDKQSVIQGANYLANI